LRAAIALTIVVAFEVWYFARGWQTLWDLAYQYLERRGFMYWKWITNASAVFAALPIVLVAFVAWGVSFRLLSRGRLADGETRCRKCHYILRGITEPRCPECGERI
jgi:uncharacterized paraquat-inducible protein A